MSDPFESMFDSLRGQHPPAPFAPVEAVRRRGRQRARRQVAVAGVAVLAVGGVGVTAAAAAVGGQEPPPPPPAAGPYSEPPHPSHAPARWLVDAEDLGPGDWRTGWEPEWTEDAGAWPWGQLCGGGWLPPRVDQVEVAFTDGPFNAADIPRWVHQVVDLLEPGTGPGVFGDIRDEIACAPGYEIIDQGFAGDDSLLITDPGKAQVALVRVDDAVTMVRAYSPESGRADADRLRELAVAAAGRLG